MKSQHGKWEVLAVALLAAICSVTFAFTASAQPHRKRVVAAGVAVVQGENISGARQAAVQDALRQAIEQGVGMLLDATSVVKNNDLMEKIYTNTQGYVRDYEILRERKTPDGLYRVTIQATVEPGALRDTLVSLGVIQAIMDYPRVMFLAHPEQQPMPAARTAETILVREFTGKHYDVVDPDKSAQLHNQTRGLFKADSAESAAARLGLKHHAEIVVLYQLQSGPVESDGIMEHAPVTLRTQALLTTTAQVLTADERSVTGVGKTPELALRNGAAGAAETAGESLATSIVSWWADYTTNGIPYVITLQTQPKADGLVIAFQEAVESIPGVVSLSERNSGGGITEMMVKYKFNSAQLNKAIRDALCGRSGFDKLHTVVSKGRFLVLSVL